MPTTPSFPAIQNPATEQPPEYSFDEAGPSSGSRNRTTDDEPITANHREIQAALLTFHSRQGIHYPAYQELFVLCPDCKITVLTHEMLPYHRGSIYCGKTRERD